MNLDDFLNSTLNKSGIGYGDPGQCVAFINLYTNDVFGVRYPITGLSYAGQFLDKPNTRPDLFTQVRGTSGIKRGDIIVWGGNPGHVGIFLQPSGNGFISQDQNWIPNKVTRVQHDWNNVIGYIRVKGEDMIPDADNYYWRYGKKLASQVRGRELTRAEFSKYIAGKSDLRAVEILSDDPEADVAQNWQNVGRVAVQDNWNGQITTLQNQVQDKDSQISDLNIQLGNKDKEIADLKANVGNGEDTTQLNALGSVLRWLLVRLGIK